MFLADRVGWSLSPLLVGPIMYKFTEHERVRIHLQRQPS